MDWKEIISKRTPVRYKDQITSGFVTGQYKDNFLVIDGKIISSEYIIPKSQVEDYNGKELSLKIGHDEIGRDSRF